MDNSVLYKDSLVYDIECATIGEKVDPAFDMFRFFGAYSYLYDKFYFSSNLKELQTLINKHKFVVGFNSIKYDAPILERFGISFNGKRHIDLREIIEKRKQSMQVNGKLLHLILGRSSLDEITRTLGLVDDKDGKIKDFDYNILKKDVFTDDEITYIKEYTLRDIDVTKKLYEYVEEYFAPFKFYIEPKQVAKKIYLTCSIASFAYKALCHETGIEEEYTAQTDEEKKARGQRTDDTFSGGYVGYPKGEKFIGDIYCLDFNSLYPHCYMMTNIFDRVDKDHPNAWHGGNLFKVEGYYNADKLGKVSGMAHKYYNQRVEYKKLKDSREYSLKIILNTIYGLLGSILFKNVYDRIGASDVTAIGRDMAKFARRMFRQAGYIIIYTDTDSVYLLDPFKDKARMLKVRDFIIAKIKESVPFPMDTFDMGIDDEIDCMWFFYSDKNAKDKDSDDWLDEEDLQNKELGLMKKNYIYVTKDGKIILKNLGVKKRSNSPLSKLIYEKYVCAELKKNFNCKFKQIQIKEWIHEELIKDLSLVSVRIPVKSFGYYKNETQMQAQISLKYGDGVHFLVPINIRTIYKNGIVEPIGVGKGTLLCTVDEFKEKGLRIDHIELKKVWGELGYFVKKARQVGLGGFDW